jgi:hypothetical protein
LDDVDPDNDLTWITMPPNPYKASVVKANIEGSGRNMWQGGKRQRGVGVSRPLRIARGIMGQVSRITKAFPKVVIRPYYQIQLLSMTVNNFLLLIRQKKQFLEKWPFLQARWVHEKTWNGELLLP